ncbi:ATP-binding protein [Asticcacaulis sp. 201]|uniref:ATP-binding protein n=1 Tax=Asticcacaulis sp. 201 TaxID=3028787 RepID=UPI0029165845|nr:ATP-binding protein [Asticcacaulis sp. 201]MDV6331194.1 ATP-binding protein [Asticcacaulis sp. 201]
MQIMKGVGVLVMLVLLAVGTLAWLTADDEIVEIYDSQLVNSATVLWSLTRDGAPHSAVALEESGLPLNKADRKALDIYAKWRSFRVWRDSRLVRRSGYLPAPAAQPLPAGFIDRQINGIYWRTYTLYVPDDKVIIEVSEMARARNVLIERVVRDLLIPLLIALPLLMLAIWLGIKWGLRDLQDFAQAVRSRSSRDLSPIHFVKTPAEIMPLAASLNSLLTDLGRSLEQERRFTDNAAHEMRTPLATLGAQANVILNARNATERTTAAIQLSKGVKRASRLLDQLLILARIRHAPTANIPFNLYDHARDAIRDIFPQAAEKGIDLSLSGDEAAMLTSKPALLAILLNNLLDNAIKYSPEGSAVTLTVSTGSITLCDQGPGIPEAERDLVFTRFYRIPGATQTGSGLGLSIVKNIAELLTADISLATPVHGGGLCVTVAFKP